MLTAVGDALVLLGTAYSTKSAIDNTLSGQYDEVAFDLAGYAASRAVGRQISKQFARPVTVEALKVEAPTKVIYGTPQGQLIEAPTGYRAVTAQNGKGLVLLPEGQALGNNSNIIRYGEPSVSQPGGYFRYYNSSGQPLNPLTGKPGPNSATHIPLDFQGQLLGYPGGH